jgi:glycosyltransferase involved in cell wall biosynthesis
MRILIHDYPGHAFPIQLSRTLASRGHEVLHLYAGYNVTPRGLGSRQKDDALGFSIRPLFIRKPLNKYNFVKRWQQEREYGRLLAKEITANQPEIIISANTPLDAQKMAMDAAKKVNSRFVFWLQDVIGLASKRLLQKKLSIAGSLIGTYYMRSERAMLRSSDHVVLITEDFVPLMQEWDIAQARTSVIPNWAVLDELPVQPKDNEWARMNGLENKFCFLYSGTMGLKHNPDFLLQLALHYQHDDHVRVVVISEGPGAVWLLEQREIYRLDNLLVLNFQPFERMPEVLGTADVLVAVLEPDAGVYSVPSKVLTYLCAQRPLLLAVPPENLVSRIVRQHEAGLVVSPDSPKMFVQSAEQLFESENLRSRLAGNGRHYAESNFHINEISDQFEAIMAGS